MFFRNCAVAIVVAWISSRGLLVAASASGVEELARLGAKEATYHAQHESWVTTGPLTIRAARGELTLAPGTQLVATRKVSAQGVDFLYVVGEGGVPYGLVKKSLFEAASQRNPPKPIDEKKTAPLAEAAAPSWRFDGHLVENNRGLQRFADAAKIKVALTVDMCPRPDSMEEAFFTQLAVLGKERKRPIPVTLFMTAQWLDRRHATRRREIERLRNLDGVNLLFDFANHSATHPYEKGRAVNQNFLLMKPSNFDQEVLDAERAMLRHGFVPAPAFRFPGLISTPNMRSRIKDYFSLETFGAGSWPGLGQAIRSGDVVLVHGNGGEPSGIAKLLKWLEQHRSGIRSGEVEFLDFAAAAAAQARE